EMALAVGRLGRHRVAMLGAAIGKGDALRIAARLGGELAQLLDAGAVALEAVERMRRVEAGRIPGIGEAGGAAQRRRALAGRPERRVRLLHRLRREDDVGETDMLAGKARVISCP